MARRGAARHRRRGRSVRGRVSAAAGAHSAERAVRAGCMHAPARGGAHAWHGAPARVCTGARRTPCPAATRATGPQPLRPMLARLRRCARAAAAGRLTCVSPRKSMSRCTTLLATSGKRVAAAWMAPTSIWRYSGPRSASDDWLRRTSFLSTITTWGQGGQQQRRRRQGGACARVCCARMCCSQCAQACVIAVHTRH